LSQFADVAIFMGLFLLISGPVHECAHAYTAWKLGDGTARLFGRVTLNPIAHFDPLGAGMILLSSLAGFGIGWAKPTPVNPYNLRGRYANTMVSVAGPLSNLALAMVFAIGLRLLSGSWAFWGGTFYYDSTVPGAACVVLWIGVQLNVMLMLFNLLPVPPLDGSHVLFDVLDRETAARIQPMFNQYGIFLFILLILPILPNQTSIAGAVFERIGLPIMGLLVGVPLS
jgi:Zn-dependent protease